jgi:SPP1 family predicted phage head-tail adaptor
MIRAGTLRERVTLSRLTSAEDARWGPTPTPSSYATVWAEVEPVRATERMQDGGIQSDISHVLRMRYRADVASKDRVTWRGRTLEVEGVIDVGARRRELELTCRELPTNG